MQRDKKGRFVKKAQTGLQFPTTVTLNNKTYKVKPGANQAFTSFQSKYNTFGDFLQSEDGKMWLENDTFTPSFTSTPISLNTSPQQQAEDHAQKLDVHNIMGGDSLPDWTSPTKIKYYTDSNGRNIDEYGNEITYSDLLNNKHRYQFDFELNRSKDNSILTTDKPKEKSAGINLTKEKSLNGNLNLGSINKTKLADYLEYARAGIGAGINNKIAERALEAEKPLLQDVSESHRAIYGDYRAQIEGEKAAAQLRNMASKPLTSDGALQSQMMMEAQVKGQEYIDKGRAQDDAMIKQTREVAWQQEKENQQQRQAVAMQNRQAMLMSEKNKAQIRNMRDSANFSQVISPLIQGKEQRLRNEAAQQEYYQDYYDDAMVSNNVWKTYKTTLTPEQEKLRNLFNTQGSDAVLRYIGEDVTKQDEFSSLRRIMQEEIIRQKAALKGVNLSGFGKSLNNPYSKWEPTSGSFKKGGTIYKAKLTKRTKDNDRGAKSIESSKRIAARFLEKAIDSLYTYNDVELIAKPKKKRKYQAGGGLPFVNFTPVFATSEKGAPKAAKEGKTDKEDLTSKDILELLQGMEGLPSDIDAIQTALTNFTLTDQLDPLGLDSSSSIASRYISLIGKIKKAKANREWYDKAYDKLKNDGALNEYAVDSTGHFIGMDASGEFARFTAKQVADGDVGNYQLLTNSNLLDIRARYPNAAFNSNLIMEAANGVSMNQITEHISKVIQGLGTDKNQTQIFGDQSKEVLVGLRQLQQAAQQVGQDLSISDLYEANVFTESQAQQAKLALDYIYKTMPTNMKALLFAKSGSQEGALQLINDLVNSKLSSTTKLEFSPKNKKEPKTSSSKTGNILIDGLELSPAQMLQQGFGERESILIQNKSAGGISVEAITMPVTNKGGDPVGATTLEGIATSQYGGMLDFSKASMGGKTIPFEGRRNIAVDGSKIYSMYLPIDQDEFIKGNIVPDIALIDKVNTINKQIKEKKITDPNEINQMYTDAGLPVYLNGDGTVVPQYYRRFGVLNGTAIDNAFGKDFVGSDYLKEVDDEEIINGALNIMNYGRTKEDRIEYDAQNFFNFGGLLGEYDSVYQGTIFIPMSNDVFLGIAGSGKTITSTDANNLEAKQQQKQRVSATYVNPGQLR